MGREETTIDEYLNGCRCSVITFTSGGWNLVLAKKGSRLSPSIIGIKGVIKLPNNFKIIRHYDDQTNDLIEVQIREPIGEYDYKELFYLMKPTGTFIHK